MCTLVLGLCLTATAVTVDPSDDGPLRWSDPAEVGFSTERLDAIGAAMQRYVDRGDVAGVTTLVACRGRLVHWQAVGMRDLERQDPLERDDIFRIFSMTKPITSVGIMMLVEEGKLALDGELSRTLPEFADVRVHVDGELVAPYRPITIRDLLRHTSGFTYGFFDQTPVDAMYSEAKVFSGDLANLVTEVADLPLLAQPGTTWTYSVSTDVLGRVIEVASGQTLDEFFRTRIFEPLGMVDSAFVVPAEKTSRFTVMYRASEDGSIEVDDPSAGGRFNARPVLLSGGGGLTSTAGDYVRFAQMLLNGGELDGVRILRAETVKLMRSNQLPEDPGAIRFGSFAFPGYGFGLGFSVLTDADASPEPDNDGVFRWWGYASTYFWIDPVEELVGIVMTQLSPPTVPQIEKEFQTLVYEAMTR
jgi:CubicO group peptidase (beta-lactamase class C family)